MFLRKVLLHLLLLVICLSTARAQTIKKKTYFHKWKKEKTIYKVEEFNLNNDLVVKTECQNKDCSKVDVETRVYNKNNQLIEDSIYTNKYGYHQLIWRNKYIYNNKGKLKVKERLDKTKPNELIEKTSYHYDNNDKLIKVYKYDKYLGDYIIWNTHDSAGNLTQKVARQVYDTNKLFYNRVFEYDANKNLIYKAFHSCMDDSLEVIVEEAYTYDSLNRIVLSKTPNDSIRYSYSDDGLIKKKTFYPSWFSDEFHRWIEHKYDKENKLIELQLFF